MKAFPALVCACLLASAARVVVPAEESYSELPPGRYSLELGGLVTTVCSRAIEAEWRKLPEVETVTVDFEASRAVLSIKLDKTLQTSVLRQALRKAEKLANLGTRYALRGIKYLP